MIAWSQLVLPILLSAVLVFVASSLVHMVLKWHAPDYKGFANEDEVLTAIRKGSPAPGEYVFPHCADMSQMNTPEMKAKYAQGPVGMTWLRAPGEVKLGPFLGKWFLYSVIVSALAGYMAKSTLATGASYLEVFRVVGTAAWLAYSWQGPADSIWKGKPWASTFRYMVDGLVYALLTAGAFGWLWPR